MKFFLLTLLIPLFALAYFDEDEPEHLSWNLGQNESLKTEVIIISGGPTECVCDD
jgi:hypothetical protein